jgi:competence protein ComEC
MGVVFTALFSTALAVVFVKVSAFLASVSLSLVTFFAALPGSSLSLPAPNGWEIGLYYSTLVAIAIATDKRSSADGHGRAMKILVICSLLLALVGEGAWLVQRTIEARMLRVTAIDVGQGSSTLIRFPRGTRMLIDGGGFAGDRFDVGKYVVAPFLFHARIRKLDYAVLTHPHPDHLNGLLYVLENFPVGELWLTAQVTGSDECLRLLRLVKERRIPCRLISTQREGIRIDGALVTVVAGSLIPASHRAASLNDGAIVVKIDYGDVGILLPSDISERTEASLLSTRMDLKSRVLFVPHHGSARSSSADFLGTVAPDVAVISCGTDSAYGGPRAELLARYADRKIRLFRTDRDGAVTFTTDGKALSVQTHLSNSPATVNLARPSWEYLSE